jgi:predicted nucleic acid-binding protein
MIILDTNVISEGFRIRPNDHVRNWLDSREPADLFLCAPVLAELRQGVERLPAGRKRTELDRLISAMELDLFDNRLLVFDRDSAYEFGRVVTTRTRIGQPITAMDAMIASIAIANQMAIATRDVSGFEHLGIPLINPFDPAPSSRS